MYLEKNMKIRYIWQEIMMLGFQRVKIFGISYIIVVPEAYSRFVENFGVSNKVLGFGNTDFVFIDSIGLLSDQNSEYYKESMGFLDRFNSSGKYVVLLTHVPLYRPSNSGKI